MPTNPFVPSFGAPPPLLVGRQEQLDDFEDALAEGPGSPGYATLYTGGRGAGKTVMLNAAEDIARQAGFKVISETASPGFVKRLIEHHLPTLLPPQRRKISRGNITPVGGLELEPSRPTAPNLRSLIERVTLDQALLISIDEINNDVIDELRQFATTFQHAVRERRRLAFVGAGLPAAVDRILNDHVLTFLRRADRHLLDPADIGAVADAFVSVINEAGRTISPADATLAAQATGGYPFMIQLVGYHAWKQHGDAPAITADDVNAGAIAAQRRIGRLVLEPALHDLSPIDRTFLLRMAPDDGPSKMSEIRERMGPGVDANYASQYRLRLIAAGLITSAGHGRVNFTLPHLREWLREHTDFES
ncbi:MAG: ATP-binding protein [Actinomycetota bacterium]|nr:ATP-binding protein [Actinomycetota bacterium]